MDGVSYQDFVDSDLDWLLSVMVESMLATLSKEKSATAEREALMKEAAADFDRFHNQAKKPDMITLAWRDGRRVGLV
jgi:hypothetical protein